MPHASELFCERFKLDLPLIQAPMAGVQGIGLAVAVCKTGALGSLPCAMLTAAQIVQEIETVRAATDRPFNLNFFCHTPPPPTVRTSEKEVAWQTALAPYYAELGLGSATPAAASDRAPFCDSLCDVIAAHRPPVVSFHFGLPAAHLVQRIKAWGGLVMACATTVAEAKWLEAHGADAVIAQGIEAGGHRGMFLLAKMAGDGVGLSSDFPSDWSHELATQQSTMDLLQQILQVVQIPVIAAGGIADRAGMKSALALGASAAQIGTALLLCDEVSLSDPHRQALAHSANTPSEHRTALTNLFTGRPARGIENRLMRELGPLSPLAPAFPTSASALGPLRVKAEQSGSGDFSPLWSGQNASGCRAVAAAQIIENLTTD